MQGFIKHLFVSMSVTQNLFVSVFVHKCSMMLNDVEYTTFKMFVTQMSTWFPSSQLRPRQRPLTSQNKAISVIAQPYDRFVFVSQSWHLPFGSILFDGKQLKQSYLFLTTLGMQ